MTKKIIKVAYLAPEIPSLSATFVYNEILALEERGVEILPISVHYPLSLATEKKITTLLDKTVFLYDGGFWEMLKSNFTAFFLNPARFIKAKFSLLGDIFSVGVFSSNALKLIYQFLQASKLAEILRKNNCEHLQIHFAHVPTQIGMYASMISGIPFTFTSHANDIFERGILLKEKVSRSKNAITISEFNLRFLTEQKVDAKKIKIVRCGINNEEYKFRQKASLGRVPVIGTLGRLVEKKGVDVLVLALSQLNKKGISFQLEIAGDGPLTENLKNLVKNENLEGKVIFKGSLSHDKVYDWLKNLDVFVLACKKDSNGDQDGIPVVLMEAMAVGVPVISTEISGIPELISDGKSGFLAKPNDVSSLEAKIETLLALKTVESITQEAKARVVSEFDKKINTERLINIFTA